MRSSSRSPDAESTSQDAPSLARSARAVVLGLVFYAGTHVVAAYLATNAILAGAVQAVLAEWGAGRAGVDWTARGEREDRDETDGRGAPTRLGIGALLGLGAGIAVVGFALASRAATLVPTRPVLGQALVGLVTSIITAIRDELLLRGVVITALVGWVRPGARIAVCGVAGAAAAFGAGRSSPLELLVAGLAAAALGAIWHRDRGAWMAVGASSAWSWTTGTLIRGGVADVRPGLNAWGGGDAGLAGSGASALVLSLLLVGAIAWQRRARA